MVLLMLACGGWMVVVVTCDAGLCANALKQVWAQGRPKRAASSRDWIEENHFNRWPGIRLITRPLGRSWIHRKNRSNPRHHCSNRA